MNDRRETSPSKTNQPSILAVTIAWVAVQVVPLILCAANVQLWAREAQPTSQFALYFMLFVQAGASALLFPWLLKQARTSILVMALAAAFTCTAGLVARATTGTIFEVGVGTVMWLTALWVWSKILTTRTSQLLGIVGAATVSLGVALIAYLGIEFAERNLMHVRVCAWAGLACIWIGTAIAAVWRRAHNTFSTNQSTIH